VDSHALSLPTHTHTHTHTNTASALYSAAHPGPVTGLSVSPDCKFMFSCGLDTGLDGTPIEAYDPVSGVTGSGSGSVCIWAVDLDALSTQLREGSAGSRTAPFLSLLEGGSDGEQYQTLCDLFSYAQIRSQGEASTAKVRERRGGCSF
jgi:hypothetical protein